MAINMRGKKTSLKEDAYIYEKRQEDNISEKDRIASMNKKERKTYFKDYYLKPVLIGLAIIAAVGFFLYHDLIARKNTVYRCAILNETIVTEPLTEFKTSFTNFLELDNEKNEATFNLYFTTHELASLVGASATSDLQQLSAQIYASTLDGMIGDETSLYNYLDNGFFQNIEDVLTPEEYETLKDYLYIPDHPKNKEHKAYGIYLTESPVYNELVNDESREIEKPILGILFNSEKKEYSRKLLYYLFPDLLN